MTESAVKVVNVAVGSTNPVKVNAVRLGVANALRPLPEYLDSEIQLNSCGYNVQSGVSDQPMSDEETKQGALTRAIAAFQAYVKEHGRAPEYAVGLEGGVQDDPISKEMICSAWMAVWDGSRFGSARTCSFLLPPSLSSLVRGGMELGAADDATFATVNSKQKGGTVGHLTRGGIDRTAYYVPAVELAMVPLLWKDLYT